MINLFFPPGLIMMVDLNRYKGTWHEQASTPMFFQLACLSDTNATYTIEGDKIGVDNKCKTVLGIPIGAKGDAIPGDAPNKLLVSFFPLSPRADYIVEHVDKDYQNAIVTSLNRRYIWFLTRDKVVPESRVDDLKRIAREKGIDTSRLKRTRQE